MKAIPQTLIKLDGFEKCSLSCDNGCPLGELFDFLSKIRGIVAVKMKEECEEKPAENPNEG